MINIIIADDHEMVVDGLIAIFSDQQEINVVDHAYDGAELIEKLKILPNLDVVLVDINMPVKDGIQSTKIIKELRPELKVLILSMYNKKEFVKNVMEVGADGYILKNAGKEVLIKAIKTLADGDIYFDREITKTVMISYRKGANQPDQPDQLTAREKEVIILITKGLSTEQIAEKLFLSSHTIDSHRKNILGKLGVTNVAGVIAHAIKTGLVRESDL